MYNNGSIIAYQFCIVEEAVAFTRSAIVYAGSKGGRGRNFSTETKNMLSSEIFFYVSVSWDSIGLIGLFDIFFSSLPLDIKLKITEP